MAEPRRSCDDRRQPHAFVIDCQGAFAFWCGSILLMARQNRDTRAIENTVARNKLRSTLFHWMSKHHDAIIERWDGDKIDWGTFCLELTELGLTDLTGKPASEKTARQTWFRARGAVAKKKKAKAAQPPTPINPSRVSKDWRPPNAPPPQAPAPPTPPLRSLPSKQNQLEPIRKDDGHKKPYDPEEQMAHLFRTFQERSGR